MSGRSKVVDLDRERTRQLSRTIEKDLRRGGARTLKVDVDALEDVARWRRAAIMAAHRMGHRATTYLWRRQLHVELDLPVTEAERRQAALVAESILGRGQRRC